MIFWRSTRISRGARVSIVVGAWLCLQACGVPARADDPGQVVGASASVTPDVVKPGEGSRLTIAVTIARGWHVNAHVPSEPYLIPTSVEITAPREVRVGGVSYPAGEERTFAFNPGKALRTYAGTITLSAPLKVRPDARVGRATLIRGRLRYQACNDSRCLPPRTLEVRTRLIVDRASRDDATSASAPPAPPRSGPASGLAQDWIERGSLFTYLGAFVLGLLLNLTPCVYPLIAVTIAFFGGQGGASRARVVGLATVYVMGISITFSLLGIVSAMSGAAFGTALRQPAVLIMIAGLLLALAASNFGLYQLRAPAALASWAGRSGGGAGGVLFMGLTMGIVAAPCLGPVLAGLLLVVGARQDILFGFTVFFVLSLGLGAPYVLLAALASAARGLPRSGAWLAWMEKLLGFVLVGLALFYVAPLLPAGTARFFWIGLLVVAGGYLGFMDRTGSESMRFLQIKRGVGVAALGLALWNVGTRTSTSQIHWQPLTPETLATARSHGTPAVVDFTADWCIPCREMEASTFADGAVVEAARDFAMLRADVTIADAATDAVMREHGVLGVPTYIFLGPSGDEIARLVGFVPAGEFLRTMKTAADGQRQGVTRKSPAA